MISDPKPTSGASPGSTWLNQLLEVVKRWRVKGIEGFLRQETTDGILWKKIVTPAAPIVQAQGVYFPFKIYPIGNASATDVQRAAYTTAGVDINNYTYQVRSGFIGYRSQYFFTNFNTFEIPIWCEGTDSTLIFDAQPTSNTGETIILSNSADTLIFDPTTSTVLPQAVLDPALDGLGECLASFYIKIIDDPSFGLYTQLWGRMYTEDPEIFRQYQSLPAYDDSSIFLLGVVEANPSIEFSGVQQYQTGNLVNRYAALAPLNSGFGPINIQRGYWDADSLSGQLFYQGDIVVDDTLALYTPDDNPGSSFYGVYTFTGILDGMPPIKIGIITDSPNTSPDGWTQTGTIFIPTI